MANEMVLDSDEYVISKFDKTIDIEAPSSITDANHCADATLTNKRIVLHFEQMKVFKPTVHTYSDISLSNIKVVDGHVQAIYEKNRRSGRHTLVVYLTDGSTVTLTFFDDFMGRTPKTWSSEITKLLGGTAATTTHDAGLFETTNAAAAIPHADEIAKTVAGTVDVFKSAFRRSMRETAPTVAMHCPNCGASLEVKRGSVSYCTYCGAPVNAPE